MAAFGTVPGQKVVQYLREEFDAMDIHTPGDPYDTAYKLGRRDVIQYIDQMLRIAHKEKEDDAT